MRIAFYRGTDLIDKLILFVCRGGYSHVAIVLNNETIIEAYPFKGVRQRQNISDQMKKCVVDIYEVSTTPEQDSVIHDFLKQQLGKKYDWVAILGFVLHTSEEGRKAYGRWICSELVFATFRKASIKLLERINAWKVSPTILSYNTTMKFVERKQI